MKTKKIGVLVFSFVTFFVFQMSASLKQEAIKKKESNHQRAVDLTLKFLKISSEEWGRLGIECDAISPLTISSDFGVELSIEEGVYLGCKAGSFKLCFSAPWGSFSLPSHAGFEPVRDSDWWKAVFRIIKRVGVESNGLNLNPLICIKGDGSDRGEVLLSNCPLNLQRVLYSQFKDVFKSYYKTSREVQELQEKGFFVFPTHRYISVWYKLKKVGDMVVPKASEFEGISGLRRKIWAEVNEKLKVVNEKVRVSRSEQKLAKEKLNDLRKSRWRAGCVCKTKW